MIQRSQTIWLFIAGASLFTLFFLPYVATRPPADYFEVSTYGTTQVVNSQIKVIYPINYIFLAILHFFAGLLPIFTIFKYKLRHIQLRLIALSFLCSIILIISMYIASKETLNSAGIPLKLTYFGLGILLPFVNIICLFLAMNGVRRDIKLLKSANRLR